MSEQILANGQSEDISHQFPVCTHNLFNSLLDTTFIASWRNKESKFYVQVFIIFLLSNSVTVCNWVGRTPGAVKNKMI